MVVRQIYGSLCKVSSVYLLPFGPSVAIVGAEVTLLTKTSAVKNLVCVSAVGRLLSAALPLVARDAHAFGIVWTVLVRADILLAGPF